MVATSSNNKITTMIGDVAEDEVQEEVGGAMDLVEAEIMKISKNHHQVCITIYGETFGYLLFHKCLRRVVN